MQYQGPEAKATEVEVHVALICASTDDGIVLSISCLGQRQTADFKDNCMGNRHHVTSDNVASHGDHVTESGESHVTSNQRRKEGWLPWV